MKKKQIAPAELTPIENPTGAMAVIPAKQKAAAVVLPKKETIISIPLFEALGDPDFIATNHAPKPTGMKKRIIESLQELLQENSWQGNTEEPLIKEAIQHHEKVASKTQDKLEQGIKLVTFEKGKDHKPLLITHADFMRRLGVDHSNNQIKEAEEALEQLGQTNYKFRWKYREHTGNGLYKDWIMESFVPFFHMITKQQEKKGQSKQYIFYPSQILFRGIDRPQKDVGGNKIAYLKQNPSPALHFNEEWDELTNAIWNWIYGKFQQGKIAAKKKGKPFNPKRNYAVEDLLKLHIQRKRMQSVLNEETGKKEMQPIENLEPDHVFFQRDFKKRKKKYMDKLQSALNTMQRVGALVGWEFMNEDKNVQLILTDSWPL